MYNGPFFQILTILCIVLIFNFVIKVLLIKLQQKFAKEGKIWKLNFVSSLSLPLACFIWIVAFIASLGILSTALFDYEIPYLTILLNISAILAIGWFLLRWNKALVNSMMILSRRQEIGLTPSKLDLISKLATIVTVIVIVLLLLDATGHSMQTLIAFGGISGIAIAFASQQFISNFFGGLTIYLTQPFTIGEWIDIPDHKIEGHIEEIGWYMTQVRDFEKRPIYVPNSIFNQTVVITPSRMSHQRLRLKIGLRYEDVELVQGVIDNIRKVLLHHPHVDRNLKTEVFFSDFGPTSLEIDISCYTLLMSTEFAAFKQEILLEIASAVSRQGAKIAALTNTVEISGHLENV